MKSRWTTLGVAIALAFALTVGFAFGSSRSTPAAADRGGNAAITQTDGWAVMEAMHEEMEQMMGAGGMMGGDMSSHHSGMTGGGMMGS